MTLLAGGQSDAKPVDKDAATLFDGLRKDVENSAGHAFAKWEPVSYTSQVVAGMNYRVKVKVSDEDNGYVHFKVFQPLPHTHKSPEVSAVQTGQTLGAALE